MIHFIIIRSFVIVVAAVLVTACVELPPEEEVLLPEGDFAGKKVIVLAPGFLGSLSRADFNDNERVISFAENVLRELQHRFPEEVKSSVIPEERTLEPIIGIYDKFVADLEARGFAVVSFLYDWKRHPSDTVPLLGEFVAEIAAQDPESLTLVGYSAGGLLARACVQDGVCEEVDNLITIGTPHEGTLSAYYLRGGRVAGNNALEGFVAERILGLMKMAWCPYCSDSKFVRDYLPMVDALLPASEEPFITRRQRFGETVEISVLNSCHPNRWLHDLNQTAEEIFSQVRFGVVIGSGTKTLAHVRTKAWTPADRCDLHNPAWPDGRPPVLFGKNEEYVDGDGTVTVLSAGERLFERFPDDVTIVYRDGVSHRELIADPATIDFVARFVRGEEFF